METLKQEKVEESTMAQVLVMATRGKENISTNDICYLAGMVDADGNIGITKTNPEKYVDQRTINPRYVLTLTVTNSSRKLIDWLLEKFHGRATKRQKQQSYHKQTWNWRVDHGKAIETIKMIRPYLIVKGKQADLAIDLIENWVTNQGGQGATTPQVEVDRREALYQQMRLLNQRSFPPATTKSSGPQQALGVMR